MWNILYKFQKEIINPSRGRSDCWLNLKASPSSMRSTYGLTSFKADELVFLLRTEHVNIFSKLLLEEQRFNMAIRLIEDHSSMVLKHVFPRLGDAFVRVEDTRTEAELEEILGVDKVYYLKEITSAIIKNIDEDIISLKSAFNELRKIVKTLYPNVKFVDIEFPDQESRNKV
jgi:hypothetical protein